MDVQPQRIYLDHAASTPMRPAAAAAMGEFMAQPALMSNPSSSHADGRRCRELLEGFRAQSAGRFNTSPDDIVFNSGGSEGDTQALIGFAMLLGRPVHLAVSAVEHEAVVVAARMLAGAGHRVSTIPVTADGVVELDFVEQLLKTAAPDILSVMAVNNETGVVQPVSEIAALCREYNTVYHCDAVRAVGHGFDGLLQDRNITLLNCTAHKFGGPRGVGILVQRGIRLPQLICGGSQEGGSRAGTENLAGVAGMLAALACATGPEAEAVEGQRCSMESELLDRFPFVEIHGKRAPRATHITYAAFPPKSGHKLQAALDERGISVSTGSACHDDGSVSVSPVLKAMGTAELLARCTLRISLGWNTVEADWRRLLDTLEQLIDGDAGDALDCEL